MSIVFPWAPDIFWGFPQLFFGIACVFLGLSWTYSLVFSHFLRFPNAFLYRLFFRYFLGLSLASIRFTTAFYGFNPVHWFYLVSLRSLFLSSFLSFSRCYVRFPSVFLFVPLLLVRIFGQVFDKFFEPFLVRLLARFLIRVLESRKTMTTVYSTSTWPKENALSITKNLRVCVCFDWGRTLITGGDIFWKRNT